MMGTPTDRAYALMSEVREAIAIRDIRIAHLEALLAERPAPADPALLALDAVRVAWRHERAGRITMERTDATAAALDALEATLKATPDGAGCACGQWHSTECYLGAPAPDGPASEGVTG